MKIKLLIISILTLSCLASYADSCDASHKKHSHHHKHKHKHSHKHSSHHHHKSSHHHRHSSKREYNYYYNEPAVCKPVVHSTVYTRPAYVEYSPVVQYRDVYRPYTTYRSYTPVCRSYETVYSTYEPVYRPSGMSFSFSL